MATNIHINLRVSDSFSGDNLGHLLRELAYSVEHSDMSDNSLSIYPAVPFPVKSDYLLNGEDGFWIITDGDN